MSEDATAKAKRKQVSIDPDLYRMIDFIRAGTEESIPDWVNNRLRPVVEDAYERWQIATGVKGKRETKRGE